MLRRKAKSNHTGTESALPATDQLYDLIAARAYELYELREGGAGDDLTDWLIAEREILTGTPGLKAEVADGIRNSDSAPAPEPRKKSTKLMSIGGSRKKPSSTTARSSTKPKGVHP